MLRLVMDPRNRAALAARVARAAAVALAQKQFVSAIDVLVGIGWLQAVHVEDWRRRRVPFLEAVVQTNLSKVSEAMQAFRRWATAAGLTPSETHYVARSVGREPLRFSKSGDAAIERAYRTHWISPVLGERKRARIEAKAAAAPEVVAVEARHDWKCHRCAGTGAWLVMEPAGPACLTCLGLGALVWLPSGDAAVTRRAKKASAKSLPVVRWSKSRKRYERIGLLVEPHALGAARPADDAS
jgi:hypothetical protein